MVAGQLARAANASRGRERVRARDLGCARPPEARKEE